MAGSLTVLQEDSIEDFKRLREEIYKQYGVTEILGQQNENTLPGKFKAMEIAELLRAKETKHRSNKTFMRHLFHEGAEMLWPFVEQVLEEEYKNNPIFSGAVDRESLAQIVDRVVRLAHDQNVQADFKQALANVLVLVKLLMH